MGFCNPVQMYINRLMLLLDTQLSTLDLGQRGSTTINMDNKCAVIMCVLLLSTPLIQGFAIAHGNRCMCKKLANKVNVMALAQLEVYPSNSLCEKTEYIVTLKSSGVKICVNPDLKEIKALLSGKKQSLKHIPVMSHTSDYTS
ncbi:C-X-C motif chemokine 11-like [Rana temporaria]|uniref:C-X-C motif chemokine 11-like n=1 Tax=Rana temporaria TaxID=8407 RepID=UPI001AADEF39|nr:C-X-C motif chemokine 11-like [Rana temporaria]